MELNVRRRVRQSALTFCALLFAIFAPLLSSASFAALPASDAVVPVANKLAPRNAAQAVIINPGVGLPTSTQFDITGFLQRATLNTGAACTAPTPAHCGGTVTVNNQVVIIPDETVVILPANALTWQEIFAQAPAPYGLAAAGGPETGLAIADRPAPISTYEIHVVGNRVVSGGSDTYIAGLVNISQQDLNSGAGYINYIDYDVGPNSEAELRVGGLMNDPRCVAAPNNVAAGGATCSGARVRLNDPLNANAGTGRYGRPQTPDARFTVDQDNPTIAAGTGYPMCIPRVLLDPAATLPGTNTFINPDDPLCPLTNRTQRFGGAANSMLDPTQAGGFASTTNIGAGTSVVLGYINNANFQAPMEVGDYISYAGTLVNTSATPTAAVAGSPTYISAHTITSNFAAYTRPGTNPAYVSIEVALIGTGGLTVFGAGEAAVRTRFEGMTTDPTRNVHLYGIDINPLTGAQTDRDWGYVSPDPGPAVGAVEGRWRYRPPCSGTAATVSDKLCVPPAAGQFVPPTREVRAVIDGVSVTHTFVPAPPPPVNGAGFVAPLVQSTPPNPLIDSPTASNGIAYGQYHAPIEEYIFPENTPGNPIVPNNFEAIPFLAYGGYTSAGGTQVGQLNPWPGANAPAVPVCAVATAHAPFSVIAGGSVQVSGTTIGTSPVAVSWTATITGVGDVSYRFSNPKIATPTFSAGAIATPSVVAAPLAAGTVVNLVFTASNVCGVSLPSPTTVTVTAAPPTINPIAPQTVTVSTPVALTATSTTAGPLTFNFAQTGGAPVAGFPVSIPVAVPATGATVNFTAPATAGVLTFSVTTTNAGGTSSPTTASITVNPAGPTITVVSAVYRTAKSRLVINATGPVGLIVRLQPYLTKTGTTFDPATLGATFTETTPGVYDITIVGAPQPAAAATVSGATAPFTPGAAPLLLVATTGATSVPSPLTQVRPN